MLITKAARRYASALLQIAKEQDNVKSILKDVSLIKNTIEGSKDLEVFLQSPVIKYDDKAEALDKLFGDRIDDITVRFIRLLARKNRVHLLHQVAQAFIEQYNRYAGIVEIGVASAHKLTDDQQKALHKALEEKTGKKVNMNISVDESLQGGIAVRIDDTVIDGTIKHKLERLEENFLHSAFE